MVLDQIEIIILDKMYEYRKPMTVREIASKTGYSWQTVDKYVHNLYTKKFVKILQERTRTKWEFNFELYKKLKKE